MLVKSSNKISFGVVGLPRSGTTLLNNILNSYDNSFCISEPHWVLLSNPSQLKMDKVDFQFNGVEDFTNKLVDYLKDSNFSIGGYKETYRLHERDSINYLFNSDLDIIIALYREPKSGFSAWVRSASSGYLARYPYLNVDQYIKNYKTFHKDIIELSKDKKVIFVKYEDICNGGVEYLNSKISEIEFSEIESVRKPDYIYGDPSANRGGNIRRANMDLSNIYPYIENIDNNLSEIYEKLN